MIRRILAGAAIAAAAFGFSATAASAEDGPNSIAGHSVLSQLDVLETLFASVPVANNAGQDALDNLAQDALDNLAQNALSNPTVAIPVKTNVLGNESNTAG